MHKKISLVVNILPHSLEKWVINLFADRFEVFF